MVTIEELEARIEELEIWKEKVVKYLQRLDAQNNKTTTRRMWSQEEQEFLLNNKKLGYVKLTKLWRDKFDHIRTVDSIRKKGERLGIMWGD